MLILLIKLKVYISLVKSRVTLHIHHQKQYSSATLSVSACACSSAWGQGRAFLPASRLIPRGWLRAQSRDALPAKSRDAARGLFSRELAPRGWLPRRTETFPAKVSGPDDRGRELCTQLRTIIKVYIYHFMSVYPKSFSLRQKLVQMKDTNEKQFILNVKYYVI